jgi:hypothetical protein
MLPTGALTDELRSVIVRDAGPLEAPSVVVTNGVPSAAADGSPSRDRLARIAAMIRHAEQAGGRPFRAGQTPAAVTIASVRKPANRPISRP